MSTLDDWLVQASRALDINADAIPADLRKELLDLTRDVAHGVARIAGPLTCYLVGVAVGRGQSPSAALATLTALIPDEEPTGGAGATDPGATEAGPTQAGPTHAGARGPVTDGSTAASAVRRDGSAE